MESEQSTPIPSQPTMNKPWFKWVLVMVLVALLSSLATYAVTISMVKQQQTSTSSSKTGCTEELRYCPDGRSVGRVPPSCEFSPCPTTTATSSAETKFIGVSTPTINKSTTLNPRDYPETVNWQTYTDTIAGFSIKYSPIHKVNEVIEGEKVTFFDCGGGLCFSGMGITVYKDYNGGSRREWLNNKFDLSTYDPYYEDINVASTNALVIVTRDPGSNNTVFVVMPRGNKIYLYTAPGAAIPPTQKPDLSQDKKILSTFQFTE